MSCFNLESSQTGFRFDFLYILLTVFFADPSSLIDSNFFQVFVPAVAKVGQSVAEKAMSVSPQV